VWLHWSIPLGALLLGRFQLAPGFWLGFLALLLFHVLGHAAVVRGCRLRIAAVDVHGLGGGCRWDGIATPLQRSWIAWGGILGQALLLSGALVYRFTAGAPHSGWGGDLLEALILGNVWLMALNLLPLRPFDGADAWRLFPLIWAGASDAAAVRRPAARPPPAEVFEAEGPAPDADALAKRLHEEITAELRKARTRSRD
jgi:Zn-dependent protease